MSIRDLARKCRATGMKAAESACRDFAAEVGPTDPWGTGNAKCDTGSVYRRVGVTCPSTCRRTAECYARRGRVLLSQRRSDGSTEAFLNAFEVSAVFSVTNLRTPARLLVSGDLFREGRLDTGCVSGLADRGRRLRRLLRTTRVAWGYTHAAPAEWESFQPELSDAGVEMILSDYFGPGGAVVWDHDDLEALPRVGVKYIPCPANAGRATCRKCRACFRLRAAGACVVFQPEYGASRTPTTGGT